MGRSRRMTPAGFWRSGKSRRCTAIGSTRDSLLSIPRFSTPGTARISSGRFCRPFNAKESFTPSATTASSNLWIHTRISRSSSNFTSRVWFRGCRQPRYEMAAPCAPQFMRCTMSEPTAFWNGRNVLVTGACGFLGGWMVKELRAHGAFVVGLMRDQPGETRPALHPDSQADYIVRGQLEDYECLLRALNEYEIETVLHLAAQPIVGVAYRNPRSTFEANIRGTWNLLEACREIGSVKRIVVASSDKAYGNAERLPYDESMPLLGRHPYDVSKSCADLIAQSYHLTYGLPVSI